MENILYILMVEHGIIKHAVYNWTETLFIFFNREKSNGKSQRILQRQNLNYLMNVIYT